MFTALICPSQQITLRAYNNVYCAPMESMYRTFVGRPNVEIYSNGRWYPVNLIQYKLEPTHLFMVKTSDHDIVKLTRNTYLVGADKNYTIDSMTIGDKVTTNRDIVSKIKPHNSDVTIESIEELDEMVQWLYGVQIDTTELSAVPISNGLMIRS